MTCSCRSAPVQAEVFSVPMMQKCCVVIMLSAATVVGCAADASCLCEQTAVLRDIITDRLQCIYWNLPSPLCVVIEVRVTAVNDTTMYV